VNIDKDKLSPEERAKFDAGWKNNEFNEYASNMISLHRSLPDVRHKEYVEVFSYFNSSSHRLTGYITFLLHAEIQSEVFIIYVRFRYNFVVD
jgi:hypothetical protein